MAQRPPKLGRLVVGEPPARTALAAPAQRRPLAPAAVVGWSVCCLLLAAGSVVGWQTGWLPAQFAPRKVVLRGCDLSEAQSVAQLVRARPGDSYLQWWQAVRAVKPEGARWLRSIHAAPLAGRGLLLRVAERRPVLRVESAGAGYWLCDDGSIERARLEDHGLALFQEIKRQPIVRLDGVALEDASGLARELLGIAAQCVSVVPGQIRTLALNAAGEITLFDRTGLEIRLGQPADSQVKIAALPKALRTMSADRSKVAFLDGSGKVQGSKFVFYEVRRPARQP